MKQRFVLAAIAALMFQSATAAPPNETDRRALQQLADTLDAVWDAGDAEKVTALYTADGSVRLDSRPFVEGRAAVLRYFQETIARRPAGVRHITRIENIDMLTPDLAFVDSFVSIERLDDAGKWGVLADFHNQTLAQRVGDAWRFRAVRAQRIVPPQPVATPAS